jgi:hypothetical protein
VTVRDVGSYGIYILHLESTWKMLTLLRRFVHSYFRYKSVDSPWEWNVNL